MEVVVQAFPLIETTARQLMQTPEDAAQMLRLTAVAGDQNDRSQNGLLEE
jgi:hypothetical protein